MKKLPNVELSKEDLIARKWGLVGYSVLCSIIPLVFSAFVSVPMNYYLRNKFKNTIAESHLTFQIRTFWWSLSIIVTGILTAYWGTVGYVLILIGAFYLFCRTLYGAFQLFYCRAI